MVNNASLKEHLETAFNEEQASLLAHIVGDIRAIVREIAEMQRQTETAMQHTNERIDRLIAAQQHTNRHVAEIASTHQQMGETLQHTVAHMEQLTMSFQQMAREHVELVEAQQRTEAVLQHLSKEHINTRKQVGGLATTVGYTLENEAYKALPKLLERDYGLIVQGRLTRSHVADDRGQHREIKIFGQGLIQSGSENGQPVTIIGESKAQLSRNHIDAFIIKRLKRFERVFSTLFPLLVTHMTSSVEVEEYAKTQGIALYYSYDFL